MEVTREKCSSETNCRIENKCMGKPILQVDVKIKSESDNEEESAIIGLLYADHEIKEEMVIGPEVLHKAVYNWARSEDETLRKKPKLDEKTNQEETIKEIVTEQEITVSISDADILLHKKPGGQTQEEAADRREKTNTDNDTEVEIPSNGDSQIEASSCTQTKQKNKIKRLTKQSESSSRSKPHRNTEIKDKNVTDVTSYNVFTCDDCGERFKRKGELSQHIESHEKMKHKVYLKCKECSYQTVTRDSLKQHKSGTAEIGFDRW